MLRALTESFRTNKNNNDKEEIFAYIFFFGKYMEKFKWNFCLGMQADSISVGKFVGCKMSWNEFKAARLVSNLGSCCNYPLPYMLLNKLDSKCVVKTIRIYI